MAVHRELGCGFLDPVYQEALAIEFQLQDIPFRKEVDLNITYKKNILSKCYKADFICYDHVIVELKAVCLFGSDHASQILNYLKATGLEVGLLVNFGTTSLQSQRFIL